MAINLCRHDPKSFVPYVREVYKNHVLLKAGAGKRMNDLIAKLQATDTLGMVTFDQQANEAVRQNNAAVIGKAEPNVTKGGNIAKYNEIIGEDKTSVCAEFTFPKFEGTTGQEFIALQLALNAEDFEGAKAKESKAVKDGAAAAATEDDAIAPANDMGAGAAGDKSTGETDIAAKPAATEGE